MIMNWLFGTWRCATPARTVLLGRALGSTCSYGDVVLLKGTLGAGKTTFVKGFALGALSPRKDLLALQRQLQTADEEIDVEYDVDVSSPSFAICNLYESYQGELAYVMCLDQFPWSNRLFQVWHIMTCIDSIVNSKSEIWI
jgi:hypothetical protein